MKKLWKIFAVILLCVFIVLFGICSLFYIDAAQSYFVKSSQELDISEIALLCVIPNSPTWYNPRTNLDHTLSRRDKILRNMREQKYLTEEDYVSACEKIPVILDKKQIGIIMSPSMPWIAQCAV